VGTRSAVLAVTLSAAALAGCGGGDDTPEAIATPKGESLIKLSSPDIESGGTIPAEFTCDGVGTRPTIVWREVRQDAVELVMTVVDPDASDGGFTHWTIYRLPAAGGSGLAPDGQFPAGVLEGNNSAGKAGWTPPCPPEGDKAHRYVFTMYGIPKGTTLEAGAEPDAVEAVAATAVTYGRFTATYARK